MQEYVVLVDQADRQVGVEEKLQAHVTPSLHRAFSVFVMNSARALLLQQRALAKYHSPRLWSNSCCGHPRPGEALLEAAGRRLRDELGITCALTPAGSVTYRLDVGNGLYEHEYNHVLFGTFDGIAHPDPQEVADWRWADAEQLHRDLTERPAAFTPWFGIVYRRFQTWMETQF